MAMLTRSILRRHPAAIYMTFSSVLAVVLQLSIKGGF